MRRCAACGKNWAVMLLQMTMRSSASVSMRLAGMASIAAPNRLSLLRGHDLGGDVARGAAIAEEAAFRVEARLAACPEDTLAARSVGAKDEIAEGAAHGKVGKVTPRLGAGAVMHEVAASL